MKIRILASASAAAVLSMLGGASAQESGQAPARPEEQEAQRSLGNFKLRTSCNLFTLIDT